MLCLRAVVSAVVWCAEWATFILCSTYFSSFLCTQVILGMPYDEKVDVWASGCIFAELIKGEVSTH